MPRARGSPWRPWTSRLGVSWAQDVIRDLSGSTAVHVPGIGHWVVPQSPCAQSVLASFLARPTAPDRARHQLRGRSRARTVHHHPEMTSRN
ncbi:alpha/beta hydrolase [Streptomyces sp. NPDC051183]|uniref:alpha/beta hydrolase n=1 Tax=Streptomyces sp. NPDC051183 TaxID=3155165 RepID=UPI003434C9B0